LYFRINLLKFNKNQTRSLPAAASPRMAGGSSSDESVGRRASAGVARRVGVWVAARRLNRAQCHFLDRGWQLLGLHIAPDRWWVRAQREHLGGVAWHRSVRVSVCVLVCFLFVVPEFDSQKKKLKWKESQQIWGLDSRLYTYFHNWIYFEELEFGMDWWWLVNWEIVYSDIINK
jgi:hypothetical protein